MITFMKANVLVQSQGLLPQNVNFALKPGPIRAFLDGSELSNIVPTDMRSVKDFRFVSRTDGARSIPEIGSSLGPW